MGAGTAPGFAPSRLRRGLRYVVVGGVFAFPVVACGVLAWPFYGPAAVEYFGREAFDADAWKRAHNARLGDNPVRQRMVDDLLYRYPLVGQTADGVEQFLGGPTKVFVAADDTLHYLYWLGPERCFISIDSEWLDLRFHAGRVEAAEVRPD